MSKVFAPFRSIGVVTNRVPFFIYSSSIGDDYIALCVGKSFQVLRVSIIIIFHFFYIIFL